MVASRLLFASGLLLCMVPGASSPAWGLTVSEDHRYILGPEGRPVFLNGAAPWHILARLDRSETLQYLEARQWQGINALLVSFLVNDDYNTGSFDNAFGEPPFLVPNDFSTPNEAYFAHVDWFMEIARERGIIVLAAPAYIGWGCLREGFCDAMKENGPEKMREYGRWIGNRYKEYENIIWVDGGDADAGAHGAMDVVEAVAEGILESSPPQLHTAHCDRLNSAVDCYDASWLDINTTYADCQQSPAELKIDYERAVTRPYVFIEGYYEGEHETSDVCLRSQAYWALLGGAMGHVFGNRPMWDFWEDWEGALYSPGAEFMRFFGLLKDSREWEDLVPDWEHSTLVSGFGALDDGSWAAAARTGTGRTVIVYTPDQRPLTVDMERISGSEAQVWWFNPADGTASFFDTLPTTGRREFTPPFAGDWVLVIDDAAAALTAPGQGGPTRFGSVSGLKARFRPGLETLPTRTIR